MNLSIQPFSPAKTYNKPVNSTNAVSKSHINKNANITFGSGIYNPVFAFGCVEKARAPMEKVFERAAKIFGKTEKMIAGELAEFSSLMRADDVIIRKSFSKKIGDKKISASIYSLPFADNPSLFVYSEKTPGFELTKILETDPQSIFWGGQLRHSFLTQTERFANGNSMTTKITAINPRKSVQISTPQQSVEAVLSGVSARRVSGEYQGMELNESGRNYLSENVFNESVSPVFTEMIEKCRKGEPIALTTAQKLEATSKNPDVMYFIRNAKVD